MSVLQFAVFGHPVAHSLSPRIHHAFAEQFGIALDYRPIDATPEAFADAVRLFFDAAGRGANVTLPHKASAYQLADLHSPETLRAGVANVLSRCEDGALLASNTDGSGLVRDIVERHGMRLEDRRVLLLGAGGAARGIAGALLQAGVSHLDVVSRTAASAAALASAFDEPQRIGSHGWEALPRLGAYDVILHATAAGVLGESLQLPALLCTSTSLAYDLSYGPAAKGFLAWAVQAGAGTVCDGLGMLLEQAADAFELWHGRRPQTEPVYQALR